MQPRATSLVNVSPFTISISAAVATPGTASRESSRPHESLVFVVAGAGNCFLVVAKWNWNVWDETDIKYVPRQTNHNFSNKIKYPSSSPDCPANWIPQNQPLSNQTPQSPPPMIPNPETQADSHICLFSLVFWYAQERSGFSLFWWSYVEGLRSLGQGRNRFVFSCSG